MEWKLVKIDKETDHRFLNFYVLHYEVGEACRPYSYFLASRRDEESLLVSCKDFHRPDGVIMLLRYIDEGGKSKIVLTRQFRPAIGRYVYSLPAGLMDPGDLSIEETARREAKEEVGAELGEVKLLVPPSPTSEGLSDELDCIVMGDVKRFSSSNLEDFEDISKKLVDLDELKKMLDDEELVFPLPLRCLCLYIMEAWK